VLRVNPTESVTVQRKCVSLAQNIKYIWIKTLTSGQQSFGWFKVCETLVNAINVSLNVKGNTFV
jgi:hypothetical protein